LFKARQLNNHFFYKKIVVVVVVRSQRLLYSSKGSFKEASF